MSHNLAGVRYPERVVLKTMSGCVIFDDGD